MVDAFQLVCSFPFPICATGSTWGGVGSREPYFTEVESMNSSKYLLDFIITMTKRDCRMLLLFFTAVLKYDKMRKG